MKSRAYLRVSEAERKGKNETIENQRNEMMRYAEQMAVDLAYLYEDNDVSGKIPMERRPAGSKLLADIAAGRFDTLLVWKIDRLGRDTLDSLQVARRLKEAGIRILSITEPFDTSGPMGEFVFTLFASVAQMEHANILERTMLGRLESVRKGQWVGGRLPYGYTLQDKHLVPHPQQAPVVRRMFRLYIEGMSTPAIAALLNAEGVAGPAGGPWAGYSVNRILQSRLYTGEMIYRKWRQIKREGTSVGWERQPEANHIRYEVPAIIPIEQFVVAERRRTESPRTGRRSAHYPFLLTSRIYCAACEVKMHGNCCTKRPDAIYPYYRCPGCRLMIRAEVLDAGVWADIEEFAANPGATIERLRAPVEAPFDAEAITAVERRIEGKSREQERIRSAYRRGIYDEDELAAELNASRRETQLLQTQLESLRSQQVTAHNLGLQLREVERMLVLLSERAAVADDATRQDLARRLVMRADVLSREEVTVEYLFHRLGSHAGVLTIASVLQLRRAA